MTIDDKTIDKLAKLSSLEINDSRKEELKIELADIVNFVENLNEIDVRGVDATFTTIVGGQPLREDIVDADEQIAQDIMKNAPKIEENYFIVPQIIE
ncbi:MAG: Asp-tRNA(Asn)/Glu-tRNA(Gln) amidotransferase subunit GatC [Arcobacteraceae bacterium]|nr:Asp-tRNA(Asn)/Glu-tRNA(Gln) amidotransferase subunit GatC [Arcobacteraceae bacterium]